MFFAHPRRLTSRYRLLSNCLLRKFGSGDSECIFIPINVFVFRVVYFSLHRFEYGSFWPNLRESDFHYVGEGPGRGYNFNVPLNNVGMTDADYLAVFHQVLLPMASEV